MQLKKHFAYCGEQTIWRLLINNEDFLLVEERDTAYQTVRFHCLDLKTGNIILKDFQTSESFWAGIEDFSDTFIYFHHFVKPDMPWHKDIIAYSLADEKIAWVNHELVFGFRIQDRIFAYKQLFESVYFYALDSATGEILEDIGDNSARIAALKNEAEAVKDYSQYVFPSFYQSGENLIADTFIAPLLKDSEGQAEIARMNNLFFAAVHRRSPKGKLDQHIYAFDLERKKVILENIINRNLERLLFDSFFIYKHFLIMIVEKRELHVYILQNK